MGIRREYPDRACLVNAAGEQETKASWRPAMGGSDIKAVLTAKDEARPGRSGGGCLSPCRGRKWRMHDGVDDAGEVRGTTQRLGDRNGSEFGRVGWVGGGPGDSA